MYKAIIFDFGGVFSIDDNIKKFWLNNADKLQIDPDIANKASLAIWLEARIGKIDSNIFWEQLSYLVNMKPLEFKEYFIQYTGFREELYDYIKNNLYNKYKLAILSNQIESWLEPILKEKKFREIFDVVVTSYEFGSVKPDPKIYEQVLANLNIEAKYCIYIEDREENLEPAKTLGMKTIKFENYTQCVNALEAILKT